MKFKIFFLLLFLTNLTFAQKARTERLPNIPYDKYELPIDNDTITFYLTTTSDNDKNLPLIVYIQGSTTESLFIEHENQIAVTEHYFWYQGAKEKCRLLIVEKPSVKFLQTGHSKEYDIKFSLDSWGKTIVTAINYVIANEKINKNKILVAGHSEGGITAARVANLMGEKISNVAILAGEGSSQLYSLYKFADDGTYFNIPNLETSTQRIDYLTKEWKNILADPDNTEKKFFGFSYLRWSSFLKTSVIDELENYNGKILIVQGTADRAVHPESAIVAYTSLLSKGKNIELQLIENADHSFNILNKPETDGRKMVIEQTIKWFNE